MKKITQTTSRRTSLDKIEYFKEYLHIWLQEDNDMFSRGYSCFDSNCCPNCGCILDSKISTSKKCPECKERIVLRTNKITSKKLLLNESRAKEYDKHDKKRSEILFYERIISRNQFFYNSYMNKFYKLKQQASDPRDVIYPFVNYVGTQLDDIAYKKYKKIKRLPEGDMALGSFEVIRIFDVANMQYSILAEIADYKGKKDVALDIYTDVAFRGVQISVLDSVLNPYQELEMIDIMNNVSPRKILLFLKNNNYSLEKFKTVFLAKRHPFIVKTISNEEAWKYVYGAIKLYNELDSKRE